MKSIGLEKFVEALYDPEAELTYTALTGVRKQSVADVERLFSSKVIAFMEKHKYEDEAKYLTVIRNWRRSVDERGMSDVERDKLSMEFLDFIVQDLIPWCKTDEKDYSLLEVNR